MLTDRRFEKLQNFDGLKIALGSGLFTSEDPLHSQVRKTVQPAFHRCEHHAWEKAISEIATHSIAALPPGETDLAPALGSIAINIAGRVLFGMDLSGSAREIIELIDIIQTSHERRDISKSAHRNFALATEKLDALLSKHLATADATQSSVFRLIEADPSLSPEQKFQEFRTMILAGSFTTGALLSSAAHFLAHHPECESPLEHIVLETLRLHPPIWSFSRIATHSGTLGDLSFTNGHRFLISPWALHRDPVCFPDPHAFRPQRWENGLEQKLPPGAFIPFALGSRSCIGSRLALMEANIVLKTLLSAFRLSPAANKPPLTFLPLITLVPTHGTWITLSKKP